MTTTNKTIKTQAQNIMRYSHKWNLAQISRFQSILHKIITTTENPRTVALRAYKDTIPEWRRKAIQLLHEDEAVVREEAVRKASSEALMDEQD